MKNEDLRRLSEPYTGPRIDIDRRFHAAIGADVPYAGELVREICNDLSKTAIGVHWWTSTPIHERALISDYLYQCAFGIEVNLAEAKIHYLEFLEARERHDKRIADVFYRQANGDVGIKMPPAEAPVDDLINKLEGMHVCGFFQSIGSTLDCLGGAIIGVLALPWRLRMNDIAAVKKAFNKLPNTGTPGNKIQLEFQTFFESIKAASGVPEWLEFADRYRNMFIHRGRRFTFNQVTARESIVLDKDEQSRPITNSSMHLVREPDKSDAEGFMHSNVALNEDAEITLTGIFDSCRNMENAVCERLVTIWRERRANPSLIEQPASQWDANFKTCSFAGYEPTAPPLGKDAILGSRVLVHRMVSAGTDDGHRGLWTGTPWDK